MIELIHWILFFTRIAAFCYLLLMLVYMAGWQRLLKVYSTQRAEMPILSIVVAMRNEVANIEKLLQALARQSYPADNIQVVLVDDHSTDGSAAMAQRTAHLLELQNFTLILNDGIGKKQALSTALRHISGEWVIFTDADCEPHHQWAETMMSAAGQGRALMLLGPVRFSPAKGLLQTFQALEMNSLMAATAGSAGIGLPSMANGANMALHRRLLGVENDSALKPGFASGDDMFRLETILNHYGSKVVRMVMQEESMVSTAPAIGWNAFFTQRLRWVSKSGGYRRAETIVPALVVFAFNALLTVVLLLSVFFPVLLLAYLAFIVLKTLTDLPLVWPANRIAGQSRLLPWFPVFQLIYPPYVFFTALAGLLIPVRWKGRAAGR
ncbi:MAG: glycosyltransferase [Bacteroidia bacterium]|jgi:cellulose synthase/poly-beta-1,6-N-acetylglucosamine synthase-like glycosyltransferase|nr:glycosyltransferase [Bacteroidia bacterium]